MVSGLAVCTEPRSGSNYLGRLLNSTGVLGRPIEWLDRGAVLASGWPEWPSETDKQLARIPGEASFGNGVYALKVFSSHAKRSPGWSSLPGLKFVSLIRRDLLGQAISLVRAQQTNAWTHHAGKRPAVYSWDDINSRLWSLAQGETWWRVWFALRGIQPLELVYEDIVWHPQWAVDQVADLVGLDGLATIRLERVDVKVQRDEISEEWRARFLAG